MVDCATPSCCSSVSPVSPAAVSAAACCSRGTCGSSFDYSFSSPSLTSSWARSLSICSPRARISFVSAAFSLKHLCSCRPSCRFGAEIPSAPAGSWLEISASAPPGCFPRATNLSRESEGGQSRWNLRAVRRHTHRFRGAGDISEIMIRFTGSASWRRRFTAAMGLCRPGVRGANIRTPSISNVQLLKTSTRVINRPCHTHATPVSFYWRGAPAVVFICG